MSLENVRTFQHARDEAEKNLSVAIKEAVKEALTAAFERPEVNNVVFGISTAPYNDENSGQGTFGPLVNEGLLETEDGSVQTEFDSDERYNLFYDRGGADPLARELGEVLKLAGWQAAGAALGVSYYPEEGSGSSEYFVAERIQPELGGRTYRLYSNELDY